jgi:hypothetical protein
MAAFDNAKALVAHSEQRLPEIARLYEDCLREKDLKPGLAIGVKNYLENLRSALDYCATAIFKKHGQGKPSHRPYFPYAKLTDSKDEFCTTVMEKALPGVARSRPDILDLLAAHQHFGNTGNWMPIFMELTNEHKHREFTPQAQKEYTVVNMQVTLPPSGQMTLDLTNIPLGDDPEKGYKARAAKITTYEFVTTGTIAYPILQQALENIRRIVNDLAAAC